MPKINQEEYEILKNVNKKCKWIARDKPFKVNRLGSMEILDFGLTEKETKDYDPRYWKFRRPVEETE